MEGGRWKVEGGGKTTDHRPKTVDQRPETEDHSETATIRPMASGGKVSDHSRPTEDQPIEHSVGREWLSTRNLPADTSQDAADTAATTTGEKVHPWGFVLPALRLLRQERPDVAVVHFGNELPTAATILLARLTGLGKIKWIWQQDQHIHDPGRIGKRLSRLRLLSFFADHFVAVYEGGRESMKKRGIPADKITVIHNSVAPHTPIRPKGWLRKELGIGPDEVLLVTNGSLIPRKRIDFILRACAELGRGGGMVDGSWLRVEGGSRGRGERQTLGTKEALPTDHCSPTTYHLPPTTYHLPHTTCPPPPWRLLVIGEGPERERLAALAAELGIAGRAHFLGLRNDVRDILAESDLYLHASLAEAGTYAICESMSVSIPGVVTEAGAAREQIIDGVTGWVLPPDDLEGFASRIELLMTESKTRCEMGRLAHKRWHERYRVEVAAEKFYELYARLG